MHALPLAPMLAAPRDQIRGSSTVSYTFAHPGRERDREKESQGAKKRPHKESQGVRKRPHKESQGVRKRQHARPAERRGWGVGERGFMPESLCV